MCVDRVRNVRMQALSKSAQAVQITELDETTLRAFMTLRLGF
jgi:hypothetical protein